MSLRDDAAVTDILRAVRRAQEHVAGMDEAAFRLDEKTQDAVLYQTAIVGEAARRVSGEYREAHPDIPWQDMIGMRSKLIHDYEQVNLGLVWATLTSDFPMLAEMLEPIVPREGP